MISGFISITVVFFALLSIGFCKLPEYIKVCPHDHEDLSACIIDSIEHLRPRLETGIEELGVPPLEPFELDPVIMASELSGSRIAYNLTNIRVWGPSKFKLLNLTPTKTENGYEFRYNGTVPKVHLEGDYEIHSKLLFIILDGNGHFSINITEYLFESFMKGQKVVKNGANHLVFEEIKSRISFGYASVFLDNLFNGNQVLGNATNAVLNDNMQLMFEEIKPQIQSTLDKIFTKIANQITNAFTYEELFP